MVWEVGFLGGILGRFASLVAGFWLKLGNWGSGVVGSTFGVVFSWRYSVFSNFLIHWLVGCLFLA